MAPKVKSRKKKGDKKRSPETDRGAKPSDDGRKTDPVPTRKRGRPPKHPMDQPVSKKAKKRDRSPSPLGNESSSSPRRESLVLLKKRKRHSHEEPSRKADEAKKNVKFAGLFESDTEDGADMGLVHVKQPFNPYLAGDTVTGPSMHVAKSKDDDDDGLADDEGVGFDDYGHVGVGDDFVGDDLRSHDATDETLRDEGYDEAADAGDDSVVLGHDIGVGGHDDDDDDYYDSCDSGDAGSDDDTGLERADDDDEGTPSKKFNEYWDNPEKELELVRLWEDEPNMYDLSHPLHRKPWAREASLHRMAAVLNIPCKY